MVREGEREQEVFSLSFAFRFGRWTGGVCPFSQQAAAAAAAAT